ncbi:MAG TPA: outer membrane beta-barrel protein [Gemmatimonadales bacterium]|nr:outer membrane beta-barrel protein [Gemmatimonadales bacterium]
MFKHTLLAAIAGLALATPLAAQRSAGPSFGITPYAGYMRFGNLASGPLGTSLRNTGSAVYGAEATLGLTRSLAIVGNLAYSQPSLEIGAPLIGGVSVGRSSVLLYDAALRLRVPLGAGALPISPFVQAGAGAIRQSFDIGPVGTHATNTAYNVGAGADIAIGPRMGLQLMAKDYIGKFDAREATAINVDTRTTHNWAVSAGLRLGF